MGPKYNCYASDVTTSYPANGKFTESRKSSTAQFLMRTKRFLMRPSQVRIEDDVVIWAKGNENMSDLARIMETIE
ncbi:hypothetical protein KIN20_009731 [Parelaphostrongylus tenuis]|uniref:Uncharacterized protein n=1 Tax=Parelaphostrongylus tenuis TaxID=148309 RepID=A0AAD5M6T8_PARTN|nr:hypothetical protein KIN20_009731 [Parelaphostrongylus tenuis]